MKKILGTALSFALLLAGTTVFADEANTVQTPDFKFRSRKLQF